MESDCHLKQGKNPNLPQSCRPISLLCLSNKLLEQIILSRISSIVDPFFPDDQTSFRCDKFTSEQVVKLTQDIKDAHQNKYVCGAVFLNLISAYDTIWHKGLHLKSLRYKHMPDFMKKLFTNRSFVLYSRDGQLSELHRMKNGVAQGSVLGQTKKCMFAFDVALMAVSTTFE